MVKEYEVPDTKIDDITLLEPEAMYSYADYLRWSFEERVELILPNTKILQIPKYFNLKST